MAQVIKKFFYILNIVTIICLLCMVIFSVNSVRVNYQRLINVGHELEKEYSLSFDRYKNIIVFILKNKLPQTITCFNSISNLTYNLPSIKEFHLKMSKESVINNNGAEIGSDTNLTSIVECYHSNCIGVTVDKKAILDKILKSRLWEERLKDNISNWFL